MVQPRLFSLRYTFHLSTNRNSIIGLRSGALKIQDRKMTDNEMSGGGMQDWNIMDKSEGLKNAGLENDGN